MQRITNRSGNNLWKTKLSPIKESMDLGYKRSDLPWMKYQHLLSRKQLVLQGVVVQEVDEGQPCLVCADKCPGFTVHSWR